MKVLTKKKFVLVGLMLTSLTKICSAIDCQDKEKKTITCMCLDKNQVDETDCEGECPLSLHTGKQMILCGNNCAETCEDCIWKNPGNGEGLCSGAHCEWIKGACIPKKVQCSASTESIAIPPDSNAETMCDSCTSCDTMPKTFTSDTVVQCERMPELTKCEEKKEEVKRHRCKPIGLGLSRSSPISLKYKQNDNFNLNPGGAGFWWYQQVTPTSQEPSTYFKAFSFDKGYGGIQQLCGETCEKNGEGKGMYLMSMWDGKMVINIDEKHPEGMTPPDKATPEAIKAKENSSSECEKFTGEGKGFRCRLFVGAEPGGKFPEMVPYHMVMHCEPLIEDYVNDAGEKLPRDILQCTMYYYFNKKWHLLARMKQEKIIRATHYGSMTSFVEQFSPLGIQKEQPVAAWRSAKFGPPFINNQNIIGEKKVVGETKVRSTGFEQLINAQIEYNFDSNYGHLIYAEKSDSVSIGTGHTERGETPCWGSEVAFKQILKPPELEQFEKKIGCLSRKKHQAGQAGRISITKCLHDTENKNSEGEYELFVIADIIEFNVLTRKLSLHETTDEIKYVYGQVLYDMMIDCGKEERVGGGWRNVEKVNNTNKKLWQISEFHRYRRRDGSNWDIMKNKNETWYHRFLGTSGKSVINMKIDILCLSGDCDKKDYFTDIFNEAALKYMNDVTILNKFQQFKIEKFSQISFTVEAIKKIETSELTDSVPTIGTSVPTLVSSTSVQQTSLPSNPKLSRKRKRAKKQNERDGKSPKKVKKKKAQWLGKTF